MKRFLAILLVAIMLVGMLPATVLTAFAAEESVTISFEDKANRTSFNKSQQIWEQNGIKVTNDKGSGSDIADYAPARFYKNSKLTVEYSKPITKIVITCTGSSYASILGATTSGSVTTITLDGSSNTYTVNLTASQIRAKSMTVYYVAGGETPDPDVPACEHTETTVTHENGKHIETCANAECGATVPTEHKIEPQKDENYHWEACTCDEYATDPVAHDFSKDYDKDNHWDKCACGYTTEAVAHTLVNDQCDCGYKVAVKINFELVTNISNLAVDDKIIIVAKDYAFALSTTQNNNNRGQIAIEKSDKVISIEENGAVQVLTLEAGTTDGTFAFNTGSGYLHAASSGSNYLRTETDLSANSSWKIEIANDGTASVVAQGNYTRNVLQYNQSSSLFACYASASQKAIVIYKQIGEICQHDAVYPAEHTTSTTHTKYCSKCNKPQGVAELHDNVNGTCSVCNQAVDAAALTAAIVDAAYALKSGETLANVTLTGNIVAVTEAWNSQYGNSTFTIEVAGKEIGCYRVTPADGVVATNLAIGDIATVSGRITNYSGTTIRFTKESKLTALVAHAPNYTWHDDGEGNHYQKCTVCGEEINKDVHNDANGDGTCDVCQLPCGCQHVWVKNHENGVHTEYCSNEGCDAVKTEDQYGEAGVPTITLTYEDATGHWDECSCGEYTTEKVAHDEAKICRCGYRIPVETPTAGGTFIKVETAPTDWTGVYLIVYNGEDGTLALDGSVATVDAANTYKEVAINGKTITTTENFFVVIEEVEGGYSIKTSGGKYIGRGSNDNGMDIKDKFTHANSITLNNDGTVDIISGGAYLRFNATAGQMRFRYYQSGTYKSQKAISLYKWGTCEHEYRADCDDSCEICGAIREPLAEHENAIMDNGNGQHHIYCLNCDYGQGTLVDCDWDEGAYTNPTVDADGFWTYTCNECGGTKTEIKEGSMIPAVAIIGDKKYETLQEALDAATDGDTIVLQSNVEVSGKYLDVYTANNGATPRDFTLDLNGKTIAPAEDYKVSDYALLFIGLNQTLTIKDSSEEQTGKITCNAGVAVGAYGKLNLVSGTIECLGDDPENDAAVDIYDWKGGEGYEYPASGTGVISGGTIEGVLWSGGELTINGGTIEVLDVYEGQTTINNGTIGSVVIEDANASIVSAKAIDITLDVEDAKLVYADGVYTVHVHEWNDATCTAPKACATCGDIEGEALGHNYNGVVTAPDCVNGGYTTYTCSVCGDSYTGDETDALGHLNTEIRDSKEATTEEEGYTGDTWCTDCNTMIKEGEVIEKKEPTEAKAELNVYRAKTRLKDLLNLVYYFTMDTEEEVIEVGALVWTDKDETRVPYKAKAYSGYYTVEVDGVFAQEIDTRVYIIPYVQTENGYAYGQEKSTSVLSCMEYMYNSKDETAATKAVIKDLLNYANAAREYFVAKGTMTAPSKAFNTVLSEADRELAWSDEYRGTIATVEETSGEFVPSHMSVVCGIQEALRLRFESKDANVSGFVYWTEADYAATTNNHTKETATGEMEFVRSENVVKGYITGIYSYEMYDNFFVRAYNTEGKLTKTYTRSVAAYLTYDLDQYSKSDKAEDQAYVELCKAMLIYGYTAKNSDAITKG